jgi:hypothetical protein
MVVLRLGIEEQRDRADCRRLQGRLLPLLLGARAWALSFWWSGGGVRVPWRITSLLGPRLLM